MREKPEGAVRQTPTKLANYSRSARRELPPGRILISLIHTIFSRSPPSARPWEVSSTGPIFQAAVLVFLGGLYVFGPRPPDQELYGGIALDDVCHTFTFAVGTLLCLAAASRIHQFIGIVALMVGCALGFEFLQALVPRREYSLDDAVANLLGIAVSLPIGWKRLRYMTTRP